MPDVTPIVQEPTKIPPPVAAGIQGAGALAEGEPKKVEPIVDDPYEFDLDVKGQKQKLKFKDKDQMKAILQKAMYADQVIKEGSQAKKWTAELKEKLKTPQGLREVLRDPEINMDEKKWALEIVKEMMDDEKLTPEQRENRELKAYREKKEAEEKSSKEMEAQRIAQEKLSRDAQVARAEIIEAMKKYSDIPQTQATMDAVILNMRAGFRKYGKHLTPEQAMTVYSEQYWTSANQVIEKMEPEQIIKRFGQKTLDKIQQFKLNQLKEKTDPSKQQKVDGEVKKKKHLTEKEFEKHFQSLAGL